MAMVSLTIADSDRKRMNELAQLAQAGELSPDEEIEIEEYRKTTRLMEILRSKARISLARSKRTARSSLSSATGPLVKAL